MSDENVFVIPQIPELAEESVKGIIDQLEWMKKTSIKLLHKRSEISNYIDRLIKQGIAALDLEATGLNTRLDRDGNPTDKMVGVALAASRDDGVYISMVHQDTDKNVPLDFMIEELKRLAANTTLIFHNFKYDGQLLRNYGIYIGGHQCDPNSYEDTMVMMSIADSSTKNRGLKLLSKSLLNRDQLSIKDLGVTSSSKTVPAFEYVPPEKAVYYAAPDAMNTFYLYEVAKSMLDKQDPDGSNGPWTIYKKIEKPCLFVTMEMERNTVLLDVDYLIKNVKEVVESRLEECLKTIYKIANRPIDVNSPKQMATLLYDELKLPYKGNENTKSGVKQTTEDVINKIKDKHPIIPAILDYRGHEKLLGTYVNNLLNNRDEDNCVKFQLNQNRADTGRYTASGGKGIEVDGYCKVNCQNLPRPIKGDDKSFDIRRALIARPGCKIVTIDYSGEELRIAANFSREPKWIKEFLEGDADLHTMTGRIIHNKKNITKEERTLAKTMNFLIIYGGGANRFSAQTGIPVERAKKMIQDFFRQYTGLKSWIQREKKICRKRGYSKTAIGRRRPLWMFYNSSDKYINSKGDRCAVNSTIQGSGSDIIKMALSRVSKYIRENNLSDKVRILMPIHDEIVFEIANDGTPEGKAFFGRCIEEISEIMKLNDIVERLNWPVPFEVDAEYGDSMSITNDYFKEKEKAEMENKEKTNENIPQETVSEDKKEDEEKKKSDNNNEEEMNLTVINHDSEDHKGISFYAEIHSKLFGENDKESTKAFLKDEKEEVDDKIKQNLKLQELIDPRGFLEWPVTNINPIVVAQLKTALKVLNNLSGTFSGPKCRVKLVDAEGNVLYKSQHKVSADAFLFAVIWFNL